MTFRLHFLGVRGSTPCCSDQYAEYGGHTSCIVLELDCGIIIFDAGSGISTAGSLTQHLNKKINIFFTHVHLDHMMGLPFFMPVWNPTFSVDIWAGSLGSYGGIESFFNNTFTAPLFPVSFKAFSGNLTCKDFTPGTILTPLEGVDIQTTALNHPNGATGYRVNYKGRSFALITDHEHTPGVLDQDVCDFIRETDVFIYDSSYDDHNFEKFAGWGHSTWQEAVRLGQAANVKKTVIFHHDPLNTDDRMRIIEKNVRLADPTAVVSRQGMIMDILP